MDRSEKERELNLLRERVERLELDLAQPDEAAHAERYYGAYYALTGGMLGAIGAMVSLLFNVVGSLIVGQNPVRIIQVYLTFPLGAKALHLETGLALGVGCCLYVATGMLLGVPFYMVLTRYTAQANVWLRLGVASLLSLCVWCTNFYCILSWLQPLLFQGSWILDEMPPAVACATHLVFGWTMVLVYPLGLHVPYRLNSEPS